MTNIAAVPAINVVITDNLNASQPGQLAYVNGSATMNGSAAGVSFAGSTITANYGAVNGPLAPGEVVVLRFRATLDPGLARRHGGHEHRRRRLEHSPRRRRAPASRSSSAASPALAVLNGSAWHDADFDDVRDSGERALAGWAVDLYRDSQLVHSVLTDANGDYRIIGVEPNDVTGSRLRAAVPRAGRGREHRDARPAASPFTNGTAADQRTSSCRPAPICRA